MTLGDVLALVAGVALAFVGAPRDEGIGGPQRGFYTFQVIQLLEGACLALSLVSLVRIAFHRRLPSAVEWVGLLLGGSFLIEWPGLEVDEWVNWIYEVDPSASDRIDYESLRCVVAGLFAVVILAGLVVVHLGRRAFPHWLKALILTGLATLAMAAPLPVFEYYAANWISPWSGFRPDLASHLRWKGTGLAVRLPVGMLLGIPAVAALEERIRRRRWTWVEWATAVVAAVDGMAWSWKSRSNYASFTTAWMLDWLLNPAWLAVVVPLSLVVGARLGPRWRAWIEGPTDQPIRPLDSDASAAST